MLETEGKLYSYNGACVVVGGGGGVVVGEGVGVYGLMGGVW